MIARCPQCDSENLTEACALSREPHGVAHVDQGFACLDCDAVFDVDDAYRPPSPLIRVARKVA
jgi:transposase-like protein